MIIGCSRPKASGALSIAASSAVWISSSPSPLRVAYVIFVAVVWPMIVLSSASRVGISLNFEEPDSKGNGGGIATVYPGP